MAGRAEGLKIVRIRICSYINLYFILQQSLTAFGGAPPAQGSLSRYHAFGLLNKPEFNAPSIDAHRTLGSPSVHRCPPSSWLSLRESWREAPERAHRTDSTHKLPTEPPHRSLMRSCIPPRTVCTSLSPSLREVPLPKGEASSCVQTSSRSKNRNFTLRLPMPTALSALPPSINAHHTLGAPDGRAGAKRLRGLTAPIPPTNSPQNHRTDPSYETAFLPPTVCTSLSPSLREVPRPSGEARAVCELKTAR